MEYFITSLLQQDFKLDENNPYIYDKECKYITHKVLGRRLVCT